MRGVIFPGLLICSVFIASFGSPPKSFYDIKIRDIDGNPINMTSLKGKKVVIITVTDQQKDNVLLNEVNDFSLKYKDTIVVLAVSSLEDGYTQKGKDSVKGKLSKNKGLNVILTEAVYTKKASAGNQSELMQWLTYKDQNAHFNQEIRGAGHKFFLSETGELFAVIGPELPLSSPFIEKIISKSRKQKVATPVENN